MIYNFSSVTGGGGLTQLKHLASEACFKSNDVIVITRQHLQIFEGVNCEKIILSEVRLIKLLQLLCFKWLWRSRLTGQDSSYTIFGFGINTGVQKNIVNVAMPILCYEDSPYWQDLSLPNFLRFRLKRSLRIVLIRLLADVITVESHIMGRRLKPFINVPIYVAPPLHGSSSITKESLGLVHSRKFLYLTGNYKHKNIDYIYKLVEKKGEDLRRLGVRFVITGEGINNEFIERIGNVDYNDLNIVISDALVLMNISDLESISNNFIEAQLYKKPMLISDRDFALWSIRTPYVSCDPRNVTSFFEAVVKAIGGDFCQPKAIDKLTVNAKERLEFIKQL